MNGRLLLYKLWESAFVHAKVIVVSVAVPVGALCQRYRLLLSPPNGRAVWLSDPLPYLIQDMKKVLAQRRSRPFSRSRKLNLSCSNELTPITTPASPSATFS